MIINKISASEEDVKELLEHIKQQEHVINNCRLEFDMNVERVTAGRMGTEYTVSKETFDQFRTEINTALDEMWKTYEKLRELGVIKIIQAHR